MRIVPYINLSGQAEEAISFYQSVLGGKIDIMKWKDMPPDPKMPVDEAWQEKLMHGSLTISDELYIYICDSIVDPQEGVKNNVFIHLEFDSEEALKKAFETMSQGATINMPLDKTFWGALYGDLIDKYGVGWGFHYQYPE